MERQEASPPGVYFLDIRHYCDPNAFPKVVPTVRVQLRDSARRLVDLEDWPAGQVSRVNRVATAILGHAVPVEIKGQMKRNTMVFQHPMSVHLRRRNKAT